LFTVTVIPQFAVEQDQSAHAIKASNEAAMIALMVSNRVLICFRRLLMPKTRTARELFGVIASKAKQGKSNAIALHR